jgi:hypothetical protein
MTYSKSLDDMDPHAAANVRAAFAMCEADGLPLGIANTLRDQEYQTKLHNEEKAPARVTFHAKGLAIDIYINIPGHAYDTSLYPRVAEHFKRVGFSWMWDIAHNEMCHFQWDNHRAVTGQMILDGILPPPMPLYQEDEDMTSEKFAEMYNEINPMISDIDDPKLPTSLKTEVQTLLNMGAINGGTPAGVNAKDINLRLDTIKAAVIAARAVK